MDERRGFAVGLSAAVYALFIALTLVLALGFSRLDYAYKRVAAPNILLLLLGLLFTLLLALALRRADGRRTDALVLLLAPLLLLVQLVCVRAYYFRTGWDVELVLQSAFDLARGLPTEGGTYYSLYPNNLLLVYLLSKVLRLAFWLGFTEERAYLLLLGLCCLGYLVTSLLVYFVTARLSGHRAAGLWAYLVCFLLVGLSPWLSIPYSDTLGLVFPVGTLAIWLLRPEKRLTRLLRAFALGAWAMLGYRIKPQLIIVLIAVILLEGERALRRRAGRGWPERAAALLAGLLLAALAAGAMTASLGFALEKEKQIGPAHFWMMGLNEPFNGGFSLEDSEFSASFDTRSERTAADLERAGERLKAMGAGGLLRHAAKKQLTNFNDGTFAWASEGLYDGGFFKTLRDAEGERLAAFLRGIYYTGGPRFALWCGGEQALWLAVLSLSLCAAWDCRERGTAALLLALFGVGLFSLLFEARARYLFAYAPLFVTAAALGTERLREKVNSEQ